MSLEKLRTERVNRLCTLPGLISIGTGIVTYPKFEVLLVLQQCQIDAQEFVSLRNESNVSDTPKKASIQLTLVIPDPSRLLANLGPTPGTSLSSLSFNGSPVKSRNFCVVLDDMIG